MVDTTDPQWAMKLLDDIRTSSVCLTHGQRYGAPRDAATSLYEDRLAPIKRLLRQS